MDAHERGPARVGRDERGQGCAVRVGPACPDHDGLDLVVRCGAVPVPVLAGDSVRRSIGRIGPIRVCVHVGTSGNPPRPRSGRGDPPSLSPVEVLLEGLLHSSFDGVQLEVVPFRAERDERFDLGERGLAPDVDGEEGRQPGRETFRFRTLGFGSVIAVAVVAVVAVGTKGGSAVVSEEDGGSEEVDQDGAWIEVVRSGQSCGARRKRGEVPRRKLTVFASIEA